MMAAPNGRGLYVLRDYQQRSIDQLYAWLGKNDGNPCLVLPTGAGKSHIVAALCKDAVQNWPETQILMLTHSKELIEQNYEKLKQHWPNAPVGIYSASLKKKMLGEPITFAGIQSIAKKAAQIGHIDLCIVDEAHAISHKDEGGYRTLFKDLLTINPNMRIIGLSATPYRLGHGYITDKPAIFDDLIEPVSIEELIALGYLSPLRSKITGTTYDLDGVKKRGGEYIESDLQKAVDVEAKNIAIVDEVIERADNRKAWLFFCTGVVHAQNVSDALNRRGIKSACITGTTPKAEREQILHDYKAGKYRALTNCDILTTGFDYPDIDLIAFMRPTMSAGLYVQMAGRGMRVKSHTDHCLVLDFAGVVSMHGPITRVQPPRKKGNKVGEMPMKICDHCYELVHISARFCPACSAPFPEAHKDPLKLRDDDIMGIKGRDMNVTSWVWRSHVSSTSGRDLIKCTYYGDLSDAPITQYFNIFGHGANRDKAMQEVSMIAVNAGVPETMKYSDAVSICESLNGGNPPSLLEFRMDGKFPTILRRIWKNATPRSASAA